MIDPFEKQWMNKLFNGIKKTEICKNIDSETENKEIIEKINVIIDILKKEFSSDEVKDIMTGCACVRPHAELGFLRQEYLISKDIGKVHKMLQEFFESFIKDYKQLDEKQMDTIRESGWGMAGKYYGDYIEVSKIPKEFHEYFNETEEDMKKYRYCHCPRIRNVFKDGKRSPDKVYCYCGGGFYKDMWEHILNREVKIELVKALTNGDDECRYKITFR
ncbi:MAG: hypothetical protein KAH33_02810 [Candidatus Delongbacteria bacterium]|nr:hypothetical protein [Candidatus Delongbacteria bacterium]